MPVFHDQERSDLRRAYVAAWRKYRTGALLEPLEHQIVTVIEQHPEYHPVLEDIDDSTLTREFAPESGESNPFLHMGLHLAIREQAGTDRPAGVTAIHRELSIRLADPHQAEHRMIECLGEALWLSQRSGRPPDEAAYLESLRRLLGRR